MDEFGHDFNWTPEPKKMVTAVLPHPIHGRLVEKVVLMVNHCLWFKGCFYTLSWRDGDVCFYQRALAQACCV